MNRRSTLASLLALAASPVAAPRAQEAFPSRPIRIIVPFAPGGITDCTQQRAQLLCRRRFIPLAFGRTVDACVRRHHY